MELGRVFVRLFRGKSSDRLVIGADQNINLLNRNRFGGLSAVSDRQHPDARPKGRNDNDKLVFRRCQVRMGFRHEGNDFVPVENRIRLFTLLCF
jgi:hypothetical protein